MILDNTYVEIFTQAHPSIDLTTYFSFIETSRLDSPIKSKTSKHHILPRWAFPEYKSLSKHPWNKAILSHADHLMAHFLLWNLWRVSSNATPLLLMCKGFNLDVFAHDSVQNISALYSEACTAHAKRVSERCTGQTISTETRKKQSETRRKNQLGLGRLNVILNETGKWINITTEEYYTHRDKYKHGSEGKPSWNRGIPVPERQGKCRVLLAGTTTVVDIATEEYWANKHLYESFTKGNTYSLNFVVVEVIDTGERTRITKEEYTQNKHLYHFHAGKTKWYNNGADQVRIPEGGGVPEGYVPGRIPLGYKRVCKERTCPHCGLVGRGGNMLRAHFDNCKNKPQ